VKTDWLARIIRTICFPPRLQTRIGVEAKVVPHRQSYLCRIIRGASAKVGMVRLKSTLSEIQQGHWSVIVVQSRTGIRFGTRDPLNGARSFCVLVYSIPIQGIEESTQNHENSFFTMVYSIPIQGIEESTQNHENSFFTMVYSIPIQGIEELPKTTSVTRLEIPPSIGTSGECATPPNRCRRERRVAAEFGRFSCQLNCTCPFATAAEWIHRAVRDWYGEHDYLFEERF
jgi:hypothetical protein